MTVGYNAWLDEFQVVAPRSLARRCLGGSIPAGRERPLPGDAMAPRGLFSEVHLLFYLNEPREARG